MLPILLFVPPTYLFVFKTASSSLWPYLYLRSCSSNDYGTTWNGSAGAMGTGSYVNQTVTMHRAGDYTLHVFERWFAGDEVLQGPWGQVPFPSWMQNATNPSVVYSPRAPSFAAVAFRGNGPSGSAVFFTEALEDRFAHYPNWTTPFPVAGL